MPDVSRIVVFSKGIDIGLNGVMFNGGQLAPISIDGDSLEWKNAQKKDIKNITSEVMNRIMPHCMLFLLF